MWPAWRLRCAEHNISIVYVRVRTARRYFRPAGSFQDDLHAGQLISARSYSARQGAMRGMGGGGQGCPTLFGSSCLWVFHDCGRFNENDMIMVVPRRIFRLGFLVLE